MPYLPSEIWLQIIAYASPPDLWRNVRQTNRQLCDCVEQHFQDSVISDISIELSFGLPCYDGRNPLRGKAIFTFARTEGQGADRVVCALTGVQPEHYMEQLLVRWNRLRESSHGCLPQSLEWAMAIGDNTDSPNGAETTVKLKGPVAFSNIEKTIEGSAVTFMWKATMTSYFG